MLLAHDIIGDRAAARCAIFLHGVLGSRNNWKSFAQKFAGAHPAWRAVIADLRNHGDSHGFPPPHTVAACADDVRELAGSLGGVDVVIGHSYGGKVALSLLDAPQLRAVWSLDAPPGPRTFADDRNSGGEIERVLAAVRAVALPIASRRALVHDLKARGLAEPLTLWMTTNLRPLQASDPEAGLTWRFALDAVDEMVRSFGALDLWPALERRHAASPRVILVQAERGARYTSADVARAQALTSSSVAFRVLHDAGHWLHTDNPAGLLALIDAELS
ncbi:MAG TPA: alpha/beta hydrolase [Myxococcota bacterium]